MLSLARPMVDRYGNSLGTYTAADVGNVLHAARRTVFFRYNLLDSNNKFKQTLSTVISGHVAYDTTQPIKRSAKFSLLDDGTINFISDRIQPFAWFKMPDGNFATFPLGVFLLSTPPRQTDAAEVITRDVDGYDQCQILSSDKVGDRYVVSAGTNYISAISDLLSSAGITQTNLQSTTLTLPTALDWEGGTAKLHIINTLLKAINYRDIWFDANGIAMGTPYLSPTQRQAGYTYQNDSKSVMFPNVNQNIDFFSVPNKWICTVAETDRATIVSTYTNTNPDSPTSTVSRGWTFVRYVKNLNAPLSQTLDSFAARMAFEDSQVYETVVFETAIMPFHEDYDVVQLNYTKLDISANYSEIAWSMDLLPAGHMSHTIRKVVAV